MRTLAQDEVDSVEGGVAVTIVIAAVGAAGAMFAFGYAVGKDMAERDARREEAGNS